MIDHDTGNKSSNVFIYVYATYTSKVQLIIKENGSPQPIQVLCAQVGVGFRMIVLRDLEVYVEIVVRVQNVHRVMPVQHQTIHLGHHLDGIFGYRASNLNQIRIGDIY